jgi:predicted TPR repeat methyltransferase
VTNLTIPYNKFAEIYDTLYSDIYRYDHFWEEYYNFIIQTLEKRGLKPRRILELACGTGKLTKIFQDNGYSIEGLDYSKNMLKVARQKGLTVHQDNMKNYDLGKKYDLIICVFDSLNYIQTQSDLQQCFITTYNHLER